MGEMIASTRTELSLERRFSFEHCRALRTQPLSFELMFLEMRTVRRFYFKILNSIIKAIAIEVMNNFRGGKWPSKVLFHHQSMLHDKTPFDLDPAITLARNIPSQGAITASNSMRFDGGTRAASHRLLPVQRFIAVETESRVHG